MAKKQKTNVQGRNRWGIVAVLCLLVASLGFIFPQRTNQVINLVNDVAGLRLGTISEESFRLGLDLQGGAHLVYDADVSRIDPAEQVDAVEGVRDVIERRVNAIGVGEPLVQTTHIGETHRLIVELPGVEDINEAINMIGETPILEFKEEDPTPPRELTDEERSSLEAYNDEALRRAQEAAGRLKDGATFEEIVEEYSEDSLSKQNAGYLEYQPAGALPPDWVNWLESHQPGDVTEEPIEADAGFALLKRGETREGELQVSASHILICYLGARGCDAPRFTKDEARAEAQRLFEEANADNFAELARTHSTEPSAGESGGDLGSFSRGQMVAPFEEAVFAANVGEIIGPVETPFGFHIIYKTGEQPAVEYELSIALIAKQSEADYVPQNENWKSTALSGKQLDRAEVVTDPNTGAIQVSLQFDSEGADLFAQLTRENIGKRIAIFLDGAPISTPVVQQEIGGGQAVITGSFSVTEARELAMRLNTGALPVPIELISQQSVGASLGAASLAQSLKAGIVGLALVMVFMLLYYRLPGLLSAIALAFYISLVLAIFKLIGVTLTLAGIAGLILSIGMAVDANVLIFERLKEELKSGKSLKVSIEEGFLRAWTSIRDGNLSTLLIAAILLFTFQSSFVRGFALTLAIGIALSMFTAITVTRALLRLVQPWFAERGHWLFLGRKK